MTAAMLSATDTMTFDEHIARLHESGFKWHRSDAVVISQDAAQHAVNALDEHIATSGVFGETLTDAIQARDELQTAICKAVEAG
jgi:hypothetical protein